MARMLLAYGADPDATSPSALYYAVRHGCMAMARLLVQHHADILGRFLLLTLPKGTLICSIRS